MKDSITRSANTYCARLRPHLGQGQIFLNGTLMGRMGFTSILLVKGNVTIDTMLQFDLDLHGHGDGEVIFKLEIFVRRSKI